MCFLCQIGRTCDPSPPALRRSLQFGVEALPAPEDPVGECFPDSQVPGGSQAPDSQAPDSQVTLIMGETSEASETVEEPAGGNEHGEEMEKSGDVMEKNNAINEPEGQKSGHEVEKNHGLVEENDGKEPEGKEPECEKGGDEVKDGGNTEKVPEQVPENKKRPASCANTDATRGKTDKPRQTEEERKLAHRLASKRWHDKWASKGVLKEAGSDTKTEKVVPKAKAKKEKKGPPALNGHHPKDRVW